MQYKCSNCGLEKARNEFPAGTKKSGLSSWCRACTRVRAEQTLERNRQRWLSEDPRSVTLRKQCSSCGDCVSSELFGIRRNNTDGLHTRCKSCEARYRKDRSTAAAMQYLNLSVDAFDAAWQAQNGKCALCSCDLDRSTRRGCHVDHCHETGRFRGLLCGGCNTALGKLGDTPEALQRALAYVS